MTKFSFEVPIKHLQDFDDLQDYIFSLSILYDRPEYQRYIDHQVYSGLKTVWLDNSFNETFKADSKESLARLYFKHRLHRVIAPDSIYWSIDKFCHEFDKASSLIPVEDLIVVPPSYAHFEALRHHGAGHYAISYWVREKQFSEEEIRAIPNVHFLGLLSVHELLKYRPESCDTSMPIKIALQGMTLHDWTEQGSPHVNTKDMGPKGSNFFDYTMLPKEIDLARKNICDLKDAMRKGVCYE